MPCFLFVFFNFLVKIERLDWLLNREVVTKKINPLVPALFRTNGSSKSFPKGSNSSSQNIDFSKKRLHFTGKTRSYFRFLKSKY